MQYRQKAAPALIDLATSANWVTVGNCTKSIETIALGDGTSGSAVRFAGVAAGTNTFFDFSLGSTLAGKRGIEFDIKVDFGTYTQMLGAGVTGTVQVRDGGGTNNASATIAYSRGWQRVRIDRADLANLSGSPNLDSTLFSTLRFKLDAIPGVTHNCWIRNVNWSGYSRPQICIQFDDIGDSVRTIAWPIMSSRKLVGSHGVIVDAVGQSSWNGYDRISLANLQAMVSSGWDCAFHTKQHLQNTLTGYSVNQCVTEYSYFQYLIDNGLNVACEGQWGSARNLYSPYGEFSDNMFAAAQTVGLNMFRGLVGNTGQASLLGNADQICSRTMVPVYQILNTTTFASFKATVDRLVARGGSLVILFHHVVAVASTSIECSTSVFTQMMDYLHSLSSALDVVNMPTFLHRTAKSGISSAPLE